MALLLLAGACTSLVVPMTAAKPAASLDGVSVTRVSDGTPFDLGAALASSSSKTLLMLGTHAADFNTVEYIQRASAAWAQLKGKGVDQVLMVVNGEPAQCSKLASMLEPPEEMVLLSDPTGEAGRRFGVSRGFRPDDAGLSAYVKLFVVGIGLGPPWGTLPAVGIGYVGSPGGRREWIETSLKQGVKAGRLAYMAELDDAGNMVGNKFDSLPILGSWGVRPFELASLRLQNLLDVQLKHWEELKPSDERCLTQLGGCALVGPGGEPLFSWVDRGLCDLPDMEDVLDAAS